MRRTSTAGLALSSFFFVVFCFVNEKGENLRRDFPPGSPSSSPELPVKAKVRRRSWPTSCNRIPIRWQLHQTGTDRKPKNGNRWRQAGRSRLETPRCFLSPSQQRRAGEIQIKRESDCWRSHLGPPSTLLSLWHRRCFSIFFPPSVLVATSVPRTHP